MDKKAGHNEDDAFVDSMGEVAFYNTKENMPKGKVPKEIKSKTNSLTRHWEAQRKAAFEYILGKNSANMVHKPNGVPKNTGKHFKEIIKREK